jgi:flagellar hook-associated protein 2
MASLSSISGISTGIDFAALTDQIIGMERRPAERLELAIGKDTRRTDALESFRGLLTAVRTAAATFSDGSALDAFSTNVSGTDSAGRTLLAATAGAGAVGGSYAIEVGVLARAQKNTGTAQTSSSAALNYAGDFTIGAATISVAAGDSLAQIRDKINAANTGATPTRVTASILSVSPTDQRIVLTANGTGSAGAFTPANVGGGTVLQSLGLHLPPSVPADDAQFTIDGLPVTRSTNTVSDVIAGVTLTLTAAELGRKANVTIEQQPASAQAAATTFVDAYNKLATFVRDQSRQGGLLATDSSVRATRSSLAQTVLTGVVGGVEGMSTLSAAGISVSRDGTLTLDQAKLQKAYRERPTELRQLLADRGAALTATIDAQVVSGTGTIDMKKRAIQNRIGTMTSRITDIDTRLEKRRATLLAQFARSEGVIGRLKSIQDSLGTQLKQLTQSSDS